MAKPRKYTKLYENEKIQQFFELEKMSKQQIPVYISRIGKYLIWREITLEVFLKNLTENLTEEEEKINEYAKHCLYVKGGTNYAVNIRRFVRFLGYKIESPLSAIRKREKKIFFDDDQAMNQFLDIFRNNGYSESHTRRANRSLNEFCLWCNKTPTQLSQDPITAEELTQLLLDFKSVRTKDSEQFGWKKIQSSSWQLKLAAIEYFFLRIHKPSIQHLLLAKEKKIRNNGETRGMKENKRPIIKKEEISKLIDICSNYRQKSIVAGLFESGIAIGDLLNITYGQIKGKINLQNPDENPKAISFYHIRQKTNVGFYACFGRNTLYYLALHLNERKKIYSRDISPDEFIFADNKQPMTKPNAGAVRVIINSKTKSLNIQKISPHDFRRTFNTLLMRTNKLLEHQIRSMMGHLNVSMGQVYDVSKEEEVLNDYLAIWDECFNLTIDDAQLKEQEKRIEELAKENRELKLEFREFISIRNREERYMPEINLLESLVKKEVQKRLEEMKA